MTEPSQPALRENLHAVGLGQGVACDYHARPKEFSTDDAVLVEAIKLVDHPQLQLDQWPDGWDPDAALCEDHAVSAIEPTRGFEEALVNLPVTASNGVMSVSPPVIDDVCVLDVEPANEGFHPLAVDQQFMDAAEPGDMRLSRWTR